MRSSRTTVALGVLFGGVLALLLWRYDPWVFASALSHPIIVVLAVGGAAFWLAITIGYSVRDPKRAVLFKEGRFDRLEPGGRILLWPGSEIGAEVSLAEQRVLGWPILVYDEKGAEYSIIFGLTWRIVPTRPKPQPREQRMLLATNDERRRIVMQTLESTVREIARATTIDNLKAVLVNARAVEAIRQVVNVELSEDALTLDRLHVVRFIPQEDKKDKPAPVEDTRTVTEDYTVSGAGRGKVEVKLPGAQGPVTVTGIGGVRVKSHSERTEDNVRGIRVKDKDKDKDKEEDNGAVVIFCCPECDLPLDPNTPPNASGLAVRFCSHCGGPVTPCSTCGRQKQPCERCGHETR